jgi:hypothetical protein
MSVFSNPSDGTPEETDAYVRALLELLGERDPLEVLEELPGALDALVSGLSDDEIHRPEAPGKWSINEVIQHMADSEMVWSWRTRMIVAHDRPEITGYDQDLWAERLGYRDAPLDPAMDQIRALRRSNLRLVRSLSPEELRRSGVHAERGEETVEGLLRLYAGHDLVHRRQLERIRAGL